MSTSEVVATHIARMKERIAKMPKGEGAPNTARMLAWMDGMRELNEALEEIEALRRDKCRSYSRPLASRRPSRRK